MPNDLFSPKDQELLGQCLAQIQAGQPVSPQLLLDLCYARLKVLVNRQLRTFPELRGFLDPEDIMHGDSGTLKSLSAELHSIRNGVDGLVQLATRVVRNKLIDLLRSQRARTSRQQQSSLSEEQENPISPLDQMIDFEEAIEQLPEDDRRIIRSIYYGGLSVAKVAELSGVSERTVRNHLMAIRAKLAETLHDYRLPGLLSDE